MGTAKGNMISLHAFTQYIKYRLVAIGRHGLHSPFAYSMVDNCLLANSGETLENRLTQYFGNGHIIWMTQLPPAEWPDNIKSHPDKTIIIPAIHSTPVHTRYWDAVCSLHEVTMSIDIYNYGLLFFNPDFCVKQHFVLKHS